MSTADKLFQRGKPALVGSRVPETLPPRCLFLYAVSSLLPWKRVAYQRFGPVTLLSARPSGVLPRVNGVAGPEQGAPHVARLRRYRRVSCCGKPRLPRACRLAQRAVDVWRCPPSLCSLSLLAGELSRGRRSLLSALLILRKAPPAAFVCHCASEASLVWVTFFSCPLLYIMLAHKCRPRPECPQVEQPTRFLPTAWPLCHSSFPCLASGV